MMQALSERDWRRLARTIERGQCVLLLGPDVALDPTAPQSRPLPVMLAHRLAEEASIEVPAGVDRNDLSQIAQLYVRQHNLDRTDLEIAIEDFYQAYADQTSDFHRNLAALPFSLCIRTTPDAFLLNAFREVQGKTPQSEFYHYRSGQVPHLSEPDAAHPLVYGLYGDIADSQSLVLTENDLLEFLVKVIKETPALPAVVARYLASPDTSFLFLGFGFYHWYQRILLHVLHSQAPRARSLAVEADSFFRHPEGAQTTLFFDQEHAIEFRQYSWNAFAAELRQRYQDEAGVAGPAAPEPPPDAPTVFLCHSSEDRDAVAKLEQRLWDAGINTWRDRKNLRGGDQWDQVIRHVVEKQVDYVIVLHTPNVVGKAEGYVYKEIKLALERQQRFREGLRFLVPAFLSDCAKLAELEHLHYIDLTDPERVEPLVEAIRDDWTRRQQSGYAA